MSLCFTTKKKCVYIKWRATLDIRPDMFNYDELLTVKHSDFFSLLSPKLYNLSKINTWTGFFCRLTCTSRINKTWKNLAIQPQKNLKKGINPWFKPLFRSSHYLCLVLDHVFHQSYENTKILYNLCLHFARQDGQDGKKPERKSRN